MGLAVFLYIIYSSTEHFFICGFSSFVGFFSSFVGFLRIIFSSFVVFSSFVFFSSFVVATTIILPI